MVVIVLICLTVVFNAVGTGAFALTGDDAFFFAMAATVVATFLYRRHTSSTTVASGGRDVIGRALNVAILIVLLTIPSRIRAIEDAAPDISSLQDGISSLQSDIEELKNQVDSIETSITYR